jgi:hypothetical protein
VRRFLAFRNPAAIALALCLAAGSVVQADALDSPQSSAQWQQTRDATAIALTARVPQARVAHPHRSPISGIKFAGFPVGVAPRISALATGRQLEFPRTCAVLPRSGRSPPFSSRQ